MIHLLARYRWIQLAVLVFLVGWAAGATAQTVKITSITNDAPNPIPIGQPYTITIAYKWSGFPNGTGPQEIQIRDALPNTVEVLGGYAGSPNTVLQPTSFPSSNVPVEFRIISDLSASSGFGTVQINVRFKFDLTCDDTVACDRASTRFKLNNVWSNYSSSDLKSCATARASNPWKITKTQYLCQYDTAFTRVCYKIVVDRNTNTREGCYELRQVVLQDQLPSGATFDGVQAGGSGLWTSGLGNPVTFSPSSITLSPATHWYTLYYWVKYPKPQFPTGTNVTNRVSLSYSGPCGIKGSISDSNRYSLCEAINTGTMSKSFSMNLSFPNNPVYSPTIAPGCCGTYSVVYRNSGTLPQANLYIVDDEPAGVEFGSATIHVPTNGTTCVLEAQYTVGGPWNMLQTVTTPGAHGPYSLPTNVVALRWSYSGTALPVGGTLTNTIDVCFTSAVGPGTLVHNEATIKQTGSSLNLTAVNNIYGSPTAPKIIATKVFMGRGDCTGNAIWEPNDIVKFRIAVANIGSMDANNCVVTDVLPAGLSYVPNSSRYALYATTANPTVDVSHPMCGGGSLTNPFDASDPITATFTASTNQMKWTWNRLPKDCSGTVQYLIIEFDVKISAAPRMLAGQYCNTFTFVSTEVQAPGVVSNCAWITINAVSQGIARKAVGLSAAGPFSASATLAPGATGYYQLQVINTGNTPLNQVCLLDLLPFAGDKMVLEPYDPRGSAFRIPTAGNITPPAGFSASYYASNPNPSRNTLCGGFCGMPNPAGSTPLVSASSTGAGAFSVTANSGVAVLPGTPLEIIVPFTAATGAGDSSACNSFAFQGYAGGLLPTSPQPCLNTESPTACVTAPPVPTSDCCDSVATLIDPQPGDQRAGKTITIYNVKNSAISYVEILYFDCATGTQITDGRLFQVSGGTLSLNRNSVTSLVAPATDAYFNNANSYQRIPPTGGLPQWGSPASAYQNTVTFRITLPWNSQPQNWCIKLIIHHADSSVCEWSLKDWDPAPPSVTGGISPAPLDGILNFVGVACDLPLYPHDQVGYVLVEPIFAEDHVIGGSGAPFDLRRDTSLAPVTDFRLTERSAIFTLARGLKGKQQLSVFIRSQDKDRRPKVRISVFDRDANLLSVDSLIATAISSVKDQPGVVNPASGLMLGNAVPNPANTAFTVSYTLQESDEVRLELFNALGVSVGLLASGHQHAGQHEARMVVSGLAEGTYTLRLTSSKAQATCPVRIVR